MRFIPCSTTSMPTFDVIIPAYNAAHFLPSALDSVIAQTYTDWRILLVDDGSKDNTPELIAGYKEQLGDKLVYIRQANAGLPAARNAAIRHGASEFIALLDADDIWLPRRLESTLQRFRESPGAGLAYGFVSRIDATGKLLDTFDRRSTHAEGRIARYIYMRSLDLPCPTLTYRRSCLDQVGLFDETLRASEDRDLCIRVAAVSEVVLVQEVIALYRLSAQSMSTDLNRMLTAQRRVISKHYGLSGCGWRARQVALSRMYRQLAEGLSHKGQRGAALVHALRALAMYPFQLQTLRITASMLLRWAGWKANTASRLAPQ